MEKTTIEKDKERVLDFILGTHPITTKGTTQVEGGAKRRSEFDVYLNPPWFFNRALCSVIFFR
jgi:hypothetical protein